MNESVDYRALLESVPGGIALLQKKGSIWQILYAAPDTRRLLGAHSEQTSIDFCELVHPEDCALFTERLEGAALSGRRVTVQYRIRQNEGLAWVESTLGPAPGQSAGVLAITFHDITAHKTAEEEIEKKNAPFRIMADHAPVLIWMSGTDKLCYYFNQVWLEFTGRSLEQEIGNGWADGVHPDDFQHCLNIYVSSFDQRKKFSMEYRLRSKDGTYRWILDNGSPVFNAAGEFQGYIGSCVDITELKLVERALKESEQRLRSIVDNEPECVKIVARDGRVIDMNPAGLAMLEADTLEEVTSCNVLNFIEESHRAAFQEMHERVMKGEPASLEFEVVGKRGTHRWLETHAVPLFDENHNVKYHLAVTRDVTDKRSLAEQLLQSQKLSSLGTLASGIAHDFNNILAIILGYLPILERLRANPEAFSKTLASVQTAAERATTLVQQLLTFARKAEFQPESVDVNLLLQEVGAMLSQTFPAGINIEARIEGNLPFILFDANRFQQVMMNLCINARDAMPSGGTLTIEASRVAGSRLAGRFPGPLVPEYLRIVLEDTGTGMDDATRRKAFEPFFTTKKPGRGTGLGLSVVYSILRQHQGFIEIESEPGKGTRVTIYIPTTDKEPRKLKPRPPEITKGHLQTILVIEDEAMLREITEDLLSAAGYRVITAADGPEGIACLEQNTEIALAVSDLGLPSMSGAEVVNTLLAIRPDLKIIVCSGFIDPAASAQFTQKGIQILQKPYRAADLLTAIGNALERPSP